MSRLTPSDARSVLRESGVTVGGDFFALGQSTVETLLSYANAHRYRQSRHANGSRGRYWHDYLQRLAAR